MDGALLGLFMISACGFVALFEHPASPVHALVPSAFVRRALVGLAMGVTAVLLIYSPWGKRSGALMNPAMTLSFLRLQKLSPTQALGFASAQFGLGALGVVLSKLALGRWVSDPAVRYAVTEPGAYGAGVAWVAELGIAFVLVTVVMAVNRVPALARFGGFFAAALVALYITFEAPLSGMSLNPARTFASAVVAGSYDGIWIYLTAPTLGMLLGVEWDRRRNAPGEPCGKLCHDAGTPSAIPCRCLEPRSSAASSDREAGDGAGAGRPQGRRPEDGRG